MKKRNYLQFTISILLIFTMGCEDDETSNVNQPATLEPVTITTSNVNSGDIYLNFSSGNEVSSNDNWHLSIVRDTSNYNMPSIVMGTANIGLYNERHASHKQCVATISTSAKDHTWLSDDWIDEISTWEELPQAVHGATILTADADGVKSEIIYGIS